MTADNRIVLPLDRVELAARHLCIEQDCGPVHTDVCLMPLLIARQQLLHDQQRLEQISGDCQDPVKHPACSGCACPCHRHSRRT